MSTNTPDHKIDACGDNAGAAWKEAAMNEVHAFLREQGDTPFVWDELRAAIEERLPEPHDRRAWGAVARMASKLGVVEKVGYAPSKSSHGSPKAHWRSALH